jgi:hypothetical protein
MTERDPEERFPRVPLDLLEELERCFPDKCPALTAEDRDVWAMAGSVRVVRLLRHRAMVKFGG